MQQHLLFRRNVALTALAVAAVVVLALGAGIALRKPAELNLQCSGQLHSVFGDNQTLPEFSGMVTFALQDGHGYLAVNGIFKNPGATYAVQRIMRVDVHQPVEDEQSYELQPVTDHILTGDNLPEPLYTRYIFGPLEVFTATKTMNYTWLISNPYSPVLVCSSDGR